jgi:predicted ATPase/DNA-binding CsgD family transcriptional regulator
MTNALPSLLTSFLGRERETAALRQLLSQKTRLITITGPGGVGKTSLALHVAQAMQAYFPDGVYFVSLAPISDSTLIIPTIAQALSLSEGRNRLLFDSLKDYLGDRHILLLLDNFEQVISAAPLLTEMLSACAYLQVLVTSREALRLRGEQEFLLSPLELPDQTAISDVNQYPGIALFVERARTTQFEFGLTRENAATIAEICIHLDGLPLALELAAARIKLLPPQTMLAQLRDSPLRLLAGGSRDLPARQRTLRNTVQWSYDLLDADEQHAFRWFTMFAGGSTLEAALALVASAASMDLLDSLVNKNLLRSIGTNGAARLVMLETVREFGLEKLVETGEFKTARHAHAGYFVSFAEHAESELTGPDQKSWLQRLDRERDNLRAALQWAIDHQKAEIALRLAGAMLPFWFRRGYWSEGRRWLEAALALDQDPKGDQAVWAKALYAAGTLSRFQGEYTRARMLCEQSLKIYRALADQTGVLKTLAQLCRITRIQVDQEALKAFMIEAAALIETLPDSVVKGEAYTDMALTLLDFSTPKFQPRVSTFLDESERIHRALNNQSGIALAALHQGIRASYEGDFILGDARFEEAEHLATELGDVRLLSRLSGFQVYIELYKGDYAAARHRIENSIQLYNRMGDPQISSTLKFLATVLHKQGLDVWAARVLGMANTLYGNHPMTALITTFEEHFHLGDIRAELRAKLGEETFTIEFNKGHKLKLEDLRSIPHPAQPSPSEPSFPPNPPLTMREMEILRLLAQNLNNPQIAEYLVISRRTVDAHLRSIYNKLDVNSRDAAIRVAGENRLI